MCVRARGRGIFFFFLCVRERESEFVREFYGEKYLSSLMVTLQRDKGIILHRKMSTCHPKVLRSGHGF